MSTKKKPKENEEFLTINQAVRAAKVSRAWLYKLMDGGVIKYVEKYDRRLIEKASIDSYLEAK